MNRGKIDKDRSGTGRRGGDGKECFKDSFLVFEGNDDAFMEI